MHFASLIVLVSYFTTSSLAAYGVDVSLDTCQSLSSDDWNCLVQNGITFAIIQVWDGGMQYNQNIANCVADAWNAGLSHVDVYAFLCPNCDGNNPPDQAINTIISNLQGSSVNYGQLWIDVEQCSGCWNDVDSNAQFVQTAVSAAQNNGITVGIYSSDGEWGQTVGDFSGFSDLPLWYAHYDGDPSFSDTWAYNFGGWAYPAMKQYNDNGPCTNVDVDWYPD